MNRLDGVADGFVPVLLPAHEDARSLVIALSVNEQT
jgi:hypothetical protein